MNMNQSPEEVICVSQVCFSYENENVLDDVSFCAQQGDFIGLVGPNGGGKTTLLKIILGLLEPDRGSLRIFGGSPKEARQAIGYVPQQCQLDKDFPINVENVVLMGCLSSSPIFGGFSQREKELAQEALAKMDLVDYRYQQFGRLSGGQRQRVLIARALVGNPQMLIMDEPTSNLDSRSQNQIYELLNSMKGDCTIILVSHDLGVVSKQVTKVACLNRHLVIHPTSEFSSSMFEDMYHTPIQLVDHGNII